MKAFCPSCGGRLKPKCGEIYIWHWSHFSKANCDQWAESETDWHREWKSLFPKDWVEVDIKRKSGEKHRADIRCPDGLVIELQHSFISPSHIRDREAFFKNLVWVFDIRNCREPKRVWNEWAAEGDDPYLIEFRFDMRSKGQYFTFRWKYPRKHIAYTSKKTFLDLGDGRLFELKKMSRDVPCGGWGYLCPKTVFIERVKSHNK